MHKKQSPNKKKQLLLIERILAFELKYSDELCLCFILLSLSLSYSKVVERIEQLLSVCEKRKKTKKLKFQTIKAREKKLTIKKLV